MFQTVTETDENPWRLVEDHATQTSNSWYDGQVNKSYKNKAFCYIVYTYRAFIQIREAHRADIVH